MINSEKIKKAILDILLWGLLCVLIIGGMLNVRNITSLSTPFSLRYETNAICGQTAFNARKFAAQNDNEHAFWPTFRRESIAEFTGPHITHYAKTIFYSGDAALAWPVDFLHGTPPGTTDNIGCAVSEALAHRLWGSADVLGKTVLVDGHERIVRGVFKGNHELALVSFTYENTTESWNIVELTKNYPNTTRNDALSFAIQSGLGSPDYILTKNEPIFIAAILPIIPLLIISIYVLILICKYLRKYHKPISRVIPFLLLIGIALILPFILERLPGSIIPTQWSDFSFWSALIAQNQSNTREFLTATPTLRDVESSLILLRQLTIAFTSSLCAAIICFRQSAATKREAS